MLMLSGPTKLRSKKLFGNIVTNQYRIMYMQHVLGMNEFAIQQKKIRPYKDAILSYPKQRTILV